MALGEGQIASGAVGIAGLGLELAGGIMSYQGAEAANAAQKERIGYEMQGDIARRNNMERQGERMKLQALRDAQVKQSLGMNNALTQGANVLSDTSVKGGQNQIRDELGVNVSGINQSLMFGRNLYDLSAKMNQTKLDELRAQQDMLLGSALSGAGGQLIGQMSNVNTLVGNKS